MDCVEDFFRLVDTADFALMQYVRTVLEDQG